MKLEQISIQGDHIHCMVRTTRRSFFHHFFRVASGQIAQQFEKTDKLRVVVDERTRNKQRVSSQSKLRNVTDTQKRTTTKENNIVKRKLKLWMYRPFTRVVRGRTDYKNVRNYIQLNEKEALGEIVYKKDRLRGLSMAEWEVLWS